MNKDLHSSSFASALRNSLHRSETESAYLDNFVMKMPRAQSYPVGQIGENGKRLTQSIVIS